MRIGELPGILVFTPTLHATSINRLALPRGQIRYSARIDDCCQVISKSVSVHFQILDITFFYIKQIL